jgi:hypothetical protein
MRKFGRLAAVALTALVGVLPAHGETDAWRYFASRGKVGHVRVPMTTFVAIYQGNVGWCCWYMDIRSSGPLSVHRARRHRGLQGVVVVASAQKWNGYNWSTRLTRSLTGTIPRGRKWVRFPQIGFMDYPNDPKGIWRMAYVIIWTNRHAQVLGRRTVLPSLPEDHWCSELMICTYHPGYVNVLRLHT